MLLRLTMASIVANTPYRPGVNSAAAPWGSALSVAASRLPSSAKVPLRWVTRPRSDSVCGVPGAALGITIVPASCASARLSACAPPSRARSPVCGLVALASSAAISLSAAVRSCIAAVIAVPGSAKVIRVGAPGLVAPSVRLSPGTASVTLLLRAVMASPSILNAASPAVAASRAGAPATGSHASWARPSAPGVSVASRMKPFVAPSWPLSTSLAPSVVLAT